MHGSHAHASDGPAGWLARATRWGTCAAGVLIAGAFLSGHAEAGPAPDASCGQESSARSLNDNTPAVVDFVNNTSETLQTFWLNFSGQRVFYSQIPPGGTANQKTWITHPWIVADLSGTCLKLYVTSATQATVAVSDAASAPSPAPARSVAPSPATTGSAGAAPTLTPDATDGYTPDPARASGGAAGASGAGDGSPGSASTGSAPTAAGVPVPLLVGVVAAVAVAAGVLVAMNQRWIVGKRKEE